MARLKNMGPAKRSLMAGGIYFAIVFTLGFALGVVRVLITQPRFGDVAAVSLEAPVILTASWFAARWSVAKFGVSSGAPDRFVMGVFAFGLTMLAELGLSVLVFHYSVSAHFDTYTHIAGLIGLAAQIVFALIPWIEGSRR